MVRSSLTLESIGGSHRNAGDHGYRLLPAWLGCAIVFAVVFGPVQRAAGGVRSSPSGFTTCRSDPAQLAFHIELRGLRCSQWSKFAKDRAKASAATVIVPRQEWGYRLPALPGVASTWTCVYRVVPGPAQDNELTSSDCRSGSTFEVRWTDSPSA